MMYLQLAVVALTVVGLSLGQEGPDERLAKMEEEAQPQFNETYIFCVANKAPIPQLDITDEEACELCAKFAKGHPSIMTYHPRTCSAFVQCDRKKKNQFMENTVFRVKASIFGCAQGTYWDDDTKAQQQWSPAANCRNNPCNINRNTTDGRFCYSYMTCLKNGEAYTLENYECGINQSVNASTGNCQEDRTCQREVARKYTNLYCNASVPVTKIPGVPDEAYFNRTFKEDSSGNVTTVAEYCTASMVFDRTQPEECKCIAKTEVQCPKTLVLRNSSMESASWAKTPEQDGQFDVEDTGPYTNWARFGGGPMNFYNAHGLTNNEVSGSFGFIMRFVLTQQPTGDVALASNSINSETCPTASIKLYMNANRNIVFEGTNIEGVTARVQSPTVNTANPVKVSVRREGGDLYMSVNDGPEVRSTVSLGALRLKATACGLVIAKCNGLQTMAGHVDAVSFTILCPASG